MYQKGAKKGVKMPQTVLPYSDVSMMPQNILPQLMSSQNMMSENMMPQNMMQMPAMMQPMAQQPAMKQSACIPQETEITNVMLAHAYVPWQKYCGVSPDMQSLCMGTAFPELYTPYMEHCKCPCEDEE